MCFAIWELPSDNGREFVNEIVRDVTESWPGQVTIINGRPRNPRCQGLVEQGNHTVEKLLGARLHDSDCGDFPSWTEWLPLIQCKFSYIEHYSALLKLIATHH